MEGAGGYVGWTLQSNTLRHSRRPISFLRPLSAYSRADGRRAHNAGARYACTADPRATESPADTTDTRVIRAARAGGAESRLLRAPRATLVRAHRRRVSPPSARPSRHPGTTR